MESSIGLSTALKPTTGYTAGTAIVHEMLESGRGVAELVVTKGLPPAEELARIPRPEVLARPSGGVADPATV